VGFYNSVSSKKNVTFGQVVTQPLFILFFADVLAYGFFIPLLGFYWDDLDFYWLYQQTGNFGVSKYFAIDSPVLGWFYQLNFSLLGTKPWHWHAFAFFWRWVCAAGVFFLVKQILKNRTEPALMASLVFLFTPGFSQQSIAMCYGHYQMAFATLAFSLGISVYLVDHVKGRVLLTLLALFLSAINLFSTEYFFMLELLRPIMLWFKLSGQEKRACTTLKKWGPFLLLFLSATFWRVFLFPNQTASYNFDTLSTIKFHPVHSILSIAVQIINNLWQVLFGAWLDVFKFPPPDTFGKNATLLYIGLTSALVVILAVAVFKKTTEVPRQKSLLLLLLGFIACLLGGIPYWSTGLMLQSGFPNDRFALSFVLGNGLFFTGILCLLPARPVLRRSLFIILLALAGGLQVRYNIGYKRDWENLQRFSWQMSWRIPGIQPGTVVFSNEMPFKYFSDLSLTGFLNVTYGKHGESSLVPYIYYFPTVRKTDKGALTMSADQSISHNLYIGNFEGNTNQSITLYYAPPACLRILDPEIESDNWILPLYLRQTAALSSNGSSLIQPIQNVNLIEPIFKNEPEHGWCYAFEKADLARQQQDWQRVVNIGDQIIVADTKPADPTEWLVYIEGYANTNQWQRAKELSETALAVTKAMQPPLCRLWLRIDRETPSSKEKSDVLSWAQAALSCSFDK
jgi:hypothetical protein